MIDVVYPVRAGNSNDELRYSLRSLSNLPHGDVWIVGHMPDWVRGVRHVPTTAAGPKWTATLTNWLTVTDHPAFPDTFVLMNDDFFVMEPVDALPVWHHGPLADHAAACKPSGYADGLARTAVLLQATGIEIPLSYELHVPLAVDTDGWRFALEPKRIDLRLAPRSIYGNLHDLGGDLHDDVKIVDRDQAPAGPYVSTTDLSFGYSTVGRTIRAAFDQPGPYERGGRR